MSGKTRNQTRRSFGATAPTFIDYLKGILRRYPDGGQILKELIQNADDAQATEVIFIHDERSYGTESLWSDNLGQYQGPALYAYNNAVFTGEDWERIQKAGRSGKINDPNKIGRFGIGFNSVYHITDVPSIFSSEHLGLMDPQEQIFGDKGFWWFLDEPDDKEALMTMHDQFQPYRDIVSLLGKQEWSQIIENQYFSGTLFRFPLRNKASEISDNLYDSDKVVELFDSFVADADLSLLFLKSVSSVSLIHVSEDGTVNTRLEVKSSEPIEGLLKQEDKSVVEGLTKFRLITESSEEHRETKWLVTTCTMKESKVPNLDRLAKKLSFLPRVDLAFPLDEQRDCSQGRLSCFLPLPNNESNKTGLPVYVNACFGLTDNRRHIKWEEEDQKHDEHALWNELLVKEVLPQAYVKIIQDAIKLCQQSALSVSSVYNLWPDVTQMQHKDKWLNVAVDVFHHLLNQNMAVLSLARDETQFIPLSEAVMPCNGPTNMETLSAIERFLVSCGENLVSLPAKAVRAIEAYPHSNPKCVTPSFLRKVLRRSGVHNISKEDKLCVLEYILSDGQYRELEGLQLLPLSDGSFRSFTNKEEDTALIDNKEFPRMLLPYSKNLFIPHDLSSTCRTHLTELAKLKLFRVINIDKDHVVQYTRKHLPQDWRKMEKRLVTWDTSNSHHPPLDWLHEFWRFLNSHYNELSCFKEIPLIPVSPLSVSHPVSLAKLQQKTTLIFQKRGENSLPNQIAQLVTKAGGTVVRGTEWLKHEDLETYVLNPSPRSVMKVLLNLNSQQIIRDMKSESQTAREELKDYLSHLSSLSGQEKGLLITLPLFQTMTGSWVAAQSKQALVLTSGPDIPSELPVPDSVIQCATEADRRLLQLLKVNLLGPAEVGIILIDSIKNGACSNQETKNIMTWILQHGDILFSQNQSLKYKCKELKFIDGKKKASDFFDPRIKTFKMILESDFFPPSVYTETPQMLQSLTHLGLINKESDLTPEHLLHATTMIEKQKENSETEALKRGQVILEMLDGYDLLSKFSNVQLNNLKMTKWVPCDQPGTERQHLSDRSTKSRFYSPEEMRHTVYEDIVGEVMPLMGRLSDRVNTKLGLKRLPPPEKVIEKLSLLKSTIQDMDDPDTNVDFKRKLHSIYSHMQQNISEFAELMDIEPDWLWAHDQFVSPRDLVLNYPQELDLSSYIRKVPNEFLPYKKLLQKFGLRTSLSNEDIVGILHSIKQNIEARQHAFASPAEVKVSLEILNWLWKTKQTVQGDIPVPVITEDEQFTLKPKSEALLCDVSRNKLKELQFSEEEMYLLHEEIPIATAEWFKIRFLSNYILAPELIGIEQCGQSEPITTRIKNILKEYDEEGDIFKELIQNAEDAGADACKFLVDFREHKDPPESLIDPDMALCQGPCLWAFNNKQFTEDDWKNIVRVGSASKQDKVEKIGKFGLGFNTVYHVTDIPSILSGNKLLILDPNVTHLRKHIQQSTNPGIKLDLSQKRLFHCFPGLFRPYESIFDCDFTQKCPPEPYDGTLIKLPFRSEKEAMRSEICKKVYHKQDILALQQNFTKNSQTLLLFLRNVNMLSLKCMSNNISTSLTDKEIPTLLNIFKTVDDTIMVPPKTVVTKQQQAEKSLKANIIRTKVIDSSTVQIVQITSQHSGETEQQFWLIYNCFGTGLSLEMVLEAKEKAAYSLPIGGVAVRLQQEKESGKFSPLQTDLLGQAFCFLPLPIQTGLPVNINGTFAVMSNRRGLWESGVKHEWNKALLKDPLVTAYVTALSALKKMSENKQLEAYCYHTFWPEREKVSDTFKPLVDEFYSNLAQPSSGPELFFDGEHWCSMNNAIFLHQSIEQNDKISELASQVCKKYIKAPNCVVPLPLWLRKSFKQAGLEQVLQNRTWTWEKFYQEAVFKNLGTMDPKTRDTLVLHAVDLNMKKIDHLLTCYPCIPTTDGKLQYIRKLVNPSGRAACLFEPKDRRLLGGTKQDFCSPKRIQRLLELGMANDHLTLEDITHKACTMAKTFSLDKKKAYENVKCLLELMKDHLDNKNSPHWKTLRMTQFLPAFSPSDIMMNRNTTLQKPTAVFSDRSSLLVNMIHPVLDNTGLKIHNADPVLDGLGVQKSPEPEIVLQQLEEACKHSKSADASMLHKIAYECYKFLDQSISGCQNTTLISQRANSFPFILIGNTFVNVNCVAENEKFEAEPYLHVLPRAFSSFRNLWETVGVEKFFTTTQFLSVLRKIHSQHVNKALPKNDLSICLTILTKGIFKAEQKTTEDCFVPNEHGVLQPAKQLFYNDSPWMPVASGITLCHEHIPRPMAIHFGIKTTKHHTLENITVQNFSPFSFHFEQQEQLTVRIKNIISAYPSKKDILKELIQNADDAEATELHFIWDKRQHGKVKTFGEQWNNLQGPALCVFNNKVFSDDDLKGIQQLGEGGKQNLRGKIGKYGVGFNSVYHLTDCPSILTGDKLLCISDPNQKYIENHSDKPPAGIGYKLGSGFKDMYTDVYTSFLPEKFPLKEGTMFRLPLRTTMEARGSKISHQEVTEDDMNELISALSEDPEGLILFLKNICKINVHVIDDISRNIKTTLVVERTLKQESRVKKDVFAEQLKNALQSKKPITPCKTFYEISVSTSDKRQSEWIMAEQFGSHKSNDELKLTNQLPHGAIAARVNTKSPYTSLYSSNAFEGAVFCSLPLPGKTGLPVHVNGNFEVDATRKNLWKEDGQSVKLNWNESLKQLVIAPLYADLLHYIRTNINLMKGFLGSLGHQVSESYLRLWPTISTNVGPEWHQMIQAVYRSMKEKGLDVIPVLKSLTSETASHEKKRYSLDWCSLTETDSLKAPYLTDTENEKINLILETLRMKLVPAFSNMDNIWENMQSAGIKVLKVSPASVRAFLQAKPLNDPTKTDMDLPLAVTDTLIRDEKRCSELLDFCLKDSELKENEQNDLTLLDGLPLLLTKDKVLRKFNSKSPKLISIYDRLFFGYEERFADHTINGKHRVLETFNLVKKLTLPNAVEYLKPIIQRLLQSCAVNPDTGLYLPSEEMLKWLESLWGFIVSEIKLETSSADDESLTLRDVKELLSDCYILPVVHSRLNNQHLLQTMKDMSSIIPYVSEKEISHILSNLGFLKLHIVFFLKMRPQFKLILHQELMDVNDKSSVLDQVCKINQSEFSRLSSDDMKAFQNFLQSGVSMSKNRQEYERKFKSLPIFETTLGERVRIDGHKEVFVLNSKHSETFPHLFTLCNSNNTFLKYNSENLGLSEMLKIKILDDLEYFMKFILPFVQRLSEKDTLDCLKLLLLMDCMNFEYSKYKDNIISSLKSVKLISSSQGRLETASYYYDDSVELYEKMAPPEKFVPKKFWTYLTGGDECKTERARQLVRDLGMKHEVTNDDIISFAYQLESEAKETRNIEKLKQNSKLLFRKALTKVSKDKDERLLKSIADIKFIYPVKIREDLCNYHQPFASENTTVQIKGALIHGDPKHQDLIWSSMPIIHLPGYISQNLPQKMKNAGAHQQPPSQYVTRNMGNICQSPCKSEPLIKTRADVFRRAYAYLQANDFDGQSLYRLPVVLVENDTVLFKADGVCLSLNHDLEFRPYLYEISSHDAMYAEFFKKVGVKEKATAEHYCNVLAAIHADSCDKQKLNANHLITVKRAVQHLFLLMKNQGTKILSGDVQTLYLPAVDGKLHTSSSLYYNDTVFEIKRLEEGLEDRFLLLEKLSSCHLESDIFEHHRLVKMLPEKLKPKMLSQITEEKVVESNMQLCELGNSCEFSGWFDKHLSSEAFKHGLICLLREQTEGKMTQEEATEMCLKLFGSIQIVCCESLKTMLWLDGEPLHKTARETDVFVKQEQRGLTLFLKHNNDMAPKVINKVNMILTKGINALLDHKIASVHLPVLGQLLMCDDLQDVQQTLADNDIHDSVETERQTLNPPDPGTDIPDEWHDSLDMSFLNNFEEGEYVGYSTNNTYIYAVIIKELPGQSGRCSWKYKIDIGGDEPVEVGHLDLYQFKRDKKIKREGTRNTFSMELEVLVGGVPHSSQPTQSSLPASLDEAKREIDKCLAEIWILPEQERNKAIRRLYLRWHPDKNPDSQFLTTEAFKYLQNRIEELTNPSNSSRTSNYRNFYQQWNQEARRHRSGRERFFRSRGFHSYNFWTHNTNVPRPNREEARRWYKQARCDLNAAHADTSEGRTEWCLFKVHQAVEKALIAAEYKHSGKHTTGSSISATAAKVSCYHRQLRDLPQIVDELTSLGVDAKKTQYPNCHPYPHIPNERFRSANGVLAVNKASELLDKVDAYIN